MKIKVYKSDLRGSADYGWLKTKHTFSFNSYFDLEKMNFGALRVLNDDIVQPEKGFGMHRHDNMEIITIPLYGSLKHKDSEGNETVIRESEVQIMSAGSGIEHSEYNASDKNPVNFLQIWIYPKEKNIKPRYQKKSFNLKNSLNTLITLVSPDNKESLYINQDAYIYYANLQKNKSIKYKVRIKNNGIFIFVISGEIAINNSIFNEKDGIGIEGEEELKIKSITDSKILLIEIPLKNFKNGDIYGKKI
ncbi:MAG: pirin family protein [Ignavibacteria bacterium]|nr:pirin family protein [Ignavibacteria bacterium]